MIGLLIFVLTISSLFTFSESARFNFPSGPTTQFGNRSQSVDLNWRYVLAANEAINFIRCFYTEQSGAAKLVVFQQGTSNPQVNTGADFPAEFRNRIQALGGTNNEIGIRILNLQNTDNKQFQCSLDLGQLATPESQLIGVQILDPPTFITCLSGNITTIDSVALTVNCSASGNPLPTVSCHVRNVRDQEVPGTMRSASQGLELYYVVPPRLSRYNARLICIADGIQAGTKQQEAYLKIQYPPGMPKNFRVTEAKNTSITVAWLPPDDNGGAEITHYRVEYTDGSTNPSKQMNVTKDFSTLTIPGLIPNQKYGLIGFAYTIAGKGNGTNPITQRAVFTVTPTPRASDSDDNIGMIAGIAVAAVVVVIIIIIIVIIVLRKKKSGGKQKYPTSYVEDASDYPPQKDYQADANPLYTKPQKKPAAHNVSTTGYPDVVHQTNGNSGREARSDQEMDNLRPSQNNPQDPYDQDFMSPSYEHSTKEYV